MSGLVVHRKGSETGRGPGRKGVDSTTITIIIIIIIFVVGTKRIVKDLYL